MMKERPILFSGAMVRAILEGRKTQTRRIVKPQPLSDALRGPEIYCPVVVRRGEEEAGAPVFGIYDDTGEYGCKCPYGQPGDRLWVRETWGATTDINGDGAPERFHLKFDDVAPNEGMKWYADYIIFAADPEPWEWCDDDGFQTDKSFWKPSIHMPRWASRILLEVVSVRVERLQAISDQDILNEGVTDELLNELIGSAAARCVVKDEHWIHGSDEGRSYCRECAEKEITELQIANPDEEYLLDGGWGIEGDNTPFCETCGHMLSNTLTDYGASDEFDHVLENGLDLSNPESCYIFERALASQIWLKSEFHRSESDVMALETMHRACWRVLWESINGKGSWEENPWVWVVEFRRVLPVLS